MASIARMPRGPNPRSRAANRSTEGLAPVLTVLRLLTHRRARPGAGHHARAGDARPGLGRIHPLHAGMRSEEHTSELQSSCNIVCRLLLDKKTALLTTTSCRACPAPEFSITSSSGIGT